MSRFQQPSLAKRRRCQRAWLAGIGWLAFGFGSARAAAITETVPFTIQAPLAANLPAQTVNVSTPQFNSALGTFESGTTAITGTTSIALEFFTTGAGGPYDVLLSDTLTLGGHSRAFRAGADRHRAAPTSLLISRRPKTSLLGRWSDPILLRLWWALERGTNFSAFPSPCSP